MLGATGHLVVVDMGLMNGMMGFTSQPESLINRMHNTEVDFGLFGSNNAWRIFEGFSLWLAISLFFVAAYNFLIFRSVEKGHRLRIATIQLSFLLSLIFLALAATCFIIPAAIGGVLAVLFFGVAMREEKI